MFVIQQKDVVKVLQLYSCNYDVTELDMLAYYQQGKVTSCIVISVTTRGTEKYVIKFLSDKFIEKDIEEKRCSFSEFLRLNDVPVPQKYSCNGSYCHTVCIQFYNFLVTVEDYFGEDVSEITTQSSYALGCILGKMHTLSLNAKYKLNFSRIYSALIDRRTNYSAIWGIMDKDIFDRHRIEELRDLHNSKMKELQRLWEGLPMSTVHSDLGFTSNVVYKKSGFGVIDFNLSADEVLIGDLLITWYSSRYSNDFIRKVPFSKVETIRNSFLNGYQSTRKLLSDEKSNFQSMSKVINGTYFNRYVAQLVKDGNIEIGRKLSCMIEEHYFMEDTQIDIGAELGI